MSKKQTLDWDLINKILAGTATKQELRRWEALTRQQQEFAGLIPWLREMQAGQQDINSPFYAVDAWEKFKTILPVPEKAAPLIPHRTNLFLLWRKAAIAAAAAIIIGLCCWVYMRSGEKKPAELVTYSVPKGKNQLLTLPDSTLVWVNAGSSIKAPVQWENDSLREVWLEGEGFFEVQKDPARPFVVHAGEATIRVLGTSFNIEAYGQGQIAVTVNTGKIQFAAGHNQAVTLGKDQRSVWLTGSNELQTTETDASLYNVWREGVLQFNDETLQNVIGTLERHFNVPIEIAGPIKNNEYCTAKFAAGESLDNILKSLHHIYGVRIIRKEGAIVIQSGQKK